MVRSGIQFEGKSIRVVDRLDGNQGIRIKDTPRLMAGATKGSSLTWVGYTRLGGGIKLEFSFRHTIF